MVPFVRFESININSESLYFRSLEWIVLNSDNKSNSPTADSWILIARSEDEADFNNVSVL